MSGTPLFSSNPRSFRPLFAAACLGFFPIAAWPQAVPSQANIDASAQRRLQEVNREAQRQRQIEEWIRIVSPALSPQQMQDPGGAKLARKALGALVRLRRTGVTPDEALRRAASSAGMDFTKVTPPVSYLRNLFEQSYGRITPTVLEKLEAGEDPAPDLVLPAYTP